MISELQELHSKLRPREERMLRWGAVAAAAALWFSIAWRDAWVLLAIPLMAAAGTAVAIRDRRSFPVAPEEPDDDAWSY
jgi:hypothetical protein